MNQRQRRIQVDFALQYCLLNLLSFTRKFFSNSRAKHAIGHSRIAKLGLALTWDTFFVVQSGCAITIIYTFICFGIFLNCVDVIIYWFA